MAGNGFEKFKIVSSGAKDLLRSAAIRDDMQRRAEAVARVAQGQTEAEVTAGAVIGPGRAGATVFGVPLREEEDRRILGGAIDAAGS